MKAILISMVPNHQGPCRAAWLNRNQVDNRINGGISGFFRNVKFIAGILPYRYGPEFHGIIKRDGIVETTKP